MDRPTRIVLVVEDEPLIRINIADALEDAGFVVLEAASVLEAVGLLGQNDEVAAVFTDVDMPGGLTGLDLAGMVSRCTRRIGIVVTSGREVSPSALPDEAQFLPKPYRLDTAIRAIEQAACSDGDAIDATARNSRAIP
jgi:DNA-binding NtrC family response regulator